MENQELINQHELDRFTFIDYLKKTNKRYIPIPDEYIDVITDKTSEQSQSIAAHIGVYTALWFKADSFNSSKLPLRERCKKFFGLTEHATKNILDKLEEIGFIVQEKQYRKKVITVISRKQGQCPTRIKVKIINKID
jgi:hypothetical protein